MVDNETGEIPRSIPTRLEKLLNAYLSTSLSQDYHTSYPGDGMSLSKEHRRGDRILEYVFTHDSSDEEQTLETISLRKDVLALQFNFQKGKFMEATVDSEIGGYDVTLQEISPNYQGSLLQQPTSPVDVEELVREIVKLYESE